MGFWFGWCSRYFLRSKVSPCENPNEQQNRPTTFFVRTPKLHSYTKDLQLLLILLAMSLLLGGALKTTIYGSRCHKTDFGVSYTYASVCRRWTDVATTERFLWLLKESAITLKRHGALVEFTFPRKLWKIDWNHCANAGSVQFWSAIHLCFAVAT